MQNSSDNYNDSNTSPAGDGVSDEKQQTPPVHKPIYSLSALAKHYGPGRVLSAFVGLMLLAGGVGAGVVLVSQPQLLEQRAQVVDYACTSSGETRCTNDPNKIEVCTGNVWQTSNCGTGMKCSNGTCITDATCGGVAKEDTAITCTTGSLVCKNNVWVCGQQCTAGNLGSLCTSGCPTGKAAYTYRRTDCSTYCNSGVQGTNCTQSIATNSCTDVNGNTLASPTLNCTTITAANCSGYQACSLSGGYDGCDPIPGTNQCSYQVDGVSCTGDCPSNMPPGYARCQCGNGVWTIGQLPDGGSCDQLCACTGNICTTCTPPPETPKPPVTPTPSPKPPSPTPVLQCNSTCTTNAQCGGNGLVCYNGRCRNQQCKGKSNCICNTPPPSPTPSPVASCSVTKIYTPSWTQLTTDDFYDLPAGGQVYFCVNGIATGGSFSKARFTINGVLRPEVTFASRNAEGFCDLYTIPENTYDITVQGEVYHTILGWL